MPPKIRHLKSELRRAGFLEETHRGKESHSGWIHPSVGDVRVNLSGSDGADARDYQERDVRKALLRVWDALGRSENRNG